MDGRRDDDPGKNIRFFRSERLYRINSEWFFAAREGDMGPYTTEGAAERAILQYITEMSELAHWQKVREEQGYHETRPSIHTPMVLELVPMDPTNAKPGSGRA